MGRLDNVWFEGHTRRRAIAVAWILALCVATTATAESLVLHVHNAVARPGGVVAIVVASYEPRPIEQGQVCLNVGDNPYHQPDAAVVLSDAADGSIEVVPGVDGGTLLRFASPSGSINIEDGPIAVIYYRVPLDAPVGARWPLTIDVSESGLRDASGVELQVLPVPGILEVVSPDDGLLLSVEGDIAVPGSFANVTVDTLEPRKVSSGTLALRFDPLLLQGEPEVVFPPRRFANVQFTSDVSQPGLVVVEFDSPDGSVNEIPLSLIGLGIDTSPDVPGGTVATFELDPYRTELLDLDGQPIPLELSPGAILFP